MRIQTLAFMFGTAIGSAVVVPVCAQEAGKNDDAPQVVNDIADNGSGIGDIVVTAQKREQSINKVGASIIAFSGETLKDRNVVSMADLAATIPGLNFSITGSGTPVFTLRGVGFTDATLSAYPNVSIYVDQVPLPFLVQAKNSNFDLERVEVLQGPQGTLFGSNSTGGAINYVAAKPTPDLQGGLSLTYGRFNNLIADGYVSGPLSNSVRFRLAGRVQHRDDWQYSYTRQDSVGKTSTAAARLLLDWDASDRLKFELNVNGWSDHSDPQQTQYYKLALQSAPQFADPRLLTYPFAPNNPRAADWSTAFPLYGDSWLFQTTLRGAYELSDNITLTSLSGLIRSTYDVFAQTQGLNLAINAYHPSGEFHNFFQELRLDNGAKGPFRWTVGLNYQQDNANERTVNNYNESSLAKRLGLFSSRDSNQQNTKNYAVFGSMEFDIFDHLTAKGGLRYTRTIRKDNSCTSDNGLGDLAAFFTAFQRRLNPGVAIPPLGINDCVSINPATNRSERFFGKLDEDNVSYRVGLDWKPTESLLIYANISKGYKAGGFPTTTASAFPEKAPVTQESLINYEVGIKTSLFDRQVFLTANGFYYDYRNKQLRSRVVTPVFGALNATINIPKSSVRGGEIALSTRPIGGFTPTISATYLDATIDKFIGSNASGTTGNFANTRMPLAPKLSVNGDLEYETPLSDRVSGLIGAGITYRSKTNALVGLPPEYDFPAYTLIDLRAGVSMDDGGWKVLLFAKNVTNKYYIISVTRQIDQIVRFTGEPATYGVTVTHRF
ncbi:TonB-dependent receptor [soil metagenome]